MQLPKLKANPDFGRMEGAAKLIQDPLYLDAYVGRVLIDSAKWRAAKLKPRVYGDRLELAGKVGTTSDLVEQAPDWLKARVAELKAEVAAEQEAGAPAQGDSDGTAPEGKTVH